MTDVLETLAWGAVLFVIVLSYATALVARHMRRKADRHLTYEWQVPTGQGTATVLREWARAMESLRWGSSLATWERRCQASLAASRRRRGLER